MFKLTPKGSKVCALWAATIVIHSMLIATGMYAAELMFDIDLPITSTAILILGYSIGHFTRGDAKQIANGEGIKDSEWKPISTAPMDGTLVIGYDPHAKARKIKFMKYEDIDRWDQRHQGWFCGHGRPLKPTHWRTQLEQPV